MSSLSTKPHAVGCKSSKVGNNTIYACVGGCPAMAAFLVQPGETRGECDDQPEPQNEAEMRAWVEAIANMLEGEKDG
jgi:hypothetical protein